MNRHNEDIQYIINEEKRTVVAILNVPRTEICDEIGNIINNRAGHYFFLPGILPSNSMLLTGVYRGKAKAHPEDEWNVEDGKRLARLRARRIYMRERKRIIKALEDVFDDIEDNIEKAADFTKGVLKNIDADMKAMNGVESDKD